MKLYIIADGGSRGNPGPSASAAVCFDENGNQQWKKGIMLEGSQTNNWAEYAAVILGLQECYSRGEHENDISLLSDSSIVINQLNGRYKVNRKKNKLFILHDEAQEILAKFPNIELKHIPRAYSQDADDLVNEVLDKHKPQNPNIPKFLKTKFS